MSKLEMTLSRVALDPRDNDRLPVWQIDPKTGRWTQRWMNRKSSEERVLQIVDQDRAELTNTVTGMLDKLTVQDAQIAAQQATLASQQATLVTIVAQLAARKEPVPLPEVTVTANQLITLTGGERTFSNLPCAGIKTTDTHLLVVPKVMPPNTGLRSWSIPANGRLLLVVQCPILTVGGTSLTVSVTAFR